MITDKMLGDLLQLLRIDAQISQATLSKEMRTQGFPWHPSTAAKAELGTRSLKATELFALAEIFNLAPTDLNPQKARQTLLKRRHQAAKQQLADLETQIRDIETELAE